MDQTTRKPEIITAIHERNLIEMVYHNNHIIIQPHCYGITNSNTECIIGFVIQSDAAGAVPTWNIYQLEQAEDFNILKETFHTAGCYNGKWLNGFKRIYARL